MNSVAKIVAISLILATAGCSHLSQNEKRILSGGAIGAGAGVAIGYIAGAPLLGALVGGGAGAAVGALTDE